MRLKGTGTLDVRDFNRRQNGVLDILLDTISTGHGQPYGAPFALHFEREVKERTTQPLAGDERSRLSNHAGLGREPKCVSVRSFANLGHRTEDGLRDALMLAQGVGIESR